MFQIENIDESLIYPGFWTQNRLLFLLAIKKACKNQVVRQRDLIKIGSFVIELQSKYFKTVDTNNKTVKYKFTKSEQKECNEVLNHLQNNGWICSFFQIKTKTQRANLLPSNQEHYQQIDLIIQSQLSFWSGKNSVEELHITLLKEIMCGTGAPFSLVCRSLFSSQQHPKGFIQVPLAEGSDRTTCLPLSARATLLMEHFKRHGFKENIMNHLEENILPANNLAYINGMDSVIYAQLQRKQLPVPLPTPTDASTVVFHYSKNKFNSRYKSINYPILIQRPKESLSTKNSQLELESSLSLPELDKDPTHAEDVLNWTVESLITISSIRSKLRRELMDDSGTYRNGVIAKEPVEKILQNSFHNTLVRAKTRAKLSTSSIDQKTIDRDIAKIKDMAHETALSIAISFIYYQLCELKNTLDSCLVYVSQIFERGLLRYPTLNLNAWDEEDIEIILADYILDRTDVSLSDTTQRSTIQSFRRVINYCKRLGVFLHIDLPQLEPYGIAITRRNHIIGIQEFDLLISQQRSLVLMLAFYGGLRASEIANLTLNDVVSIGNELYVYIRKGKTPSAKRAIPLHLLAPPSITASIHNYSEDRRIYFRAHKKKIARSQEICPTKEEVSFLNLNLKSFTRNGGIFAVRHSLTLLQNMLGQGADLHLLRHSFASHIFLRWYCCKYPDLISSLIDGNHWCFNSDGLANLRYFFKEQPNLPLPDDNTTAIIHLIKLMGHRNSTTFFQVYVHSYYTVLEHTVKRINLESDNAVLPGKLISMLMPGMKSRASQVKLVSRKTKDLATLLTD